VLVPGVDEELLPIARARESFSCKVLLPSVEFIETHTDKLASMRWLAEAGIPRPFTVAGPFIPAAPFPCIVKPRRGRGSRDVHRCDTVEELRARLALREGLIVQEYLHGQEYTVTCVADQAKRLRAVVPVKVGLKRGVTLRGETDHDEAVIALCVAIHKADPFSGIVNIQCIKAEDGTVKPFEINPRISTTTCLAMAAGVDVIGLALEDGLAPFRKVSMKRSWHTEMEG
jgi:carbamoyl-phosphate synthase large subunit